MTREQADLFACFEAVADAILVLRDDHIVWSNTAAAALIGCSRETLAGLRYAELVAPAWRSAKPNTPEIELISAANALIWVEVSRRPLALSGETLEVTTIRDVRERKLLEILLENRESTYRRSIEGSLDGYFLLRELRDESGALVDFTIVDVNAHSTDLFLLQRDEMIGRSIRALIPEPFAGDLLARYFRAMESGSALEEEFSFQASDGSRRWYHHQIVPVEGGVAVFSRNITDRKRIELALRESEYRFQALFNQSNDGVGLIDLQGKYIVANQQMAAMIGYRPEELPGLDVTQFVSPEEVEAGRRVQVSLYAGNSIPLFERIFRRKDGSEFPGEVNIALVRDADGKPLYSQAIWRDLTRRRATEDALRESEERYRIISELISDYAYAFSIQKDGTPIHEWITDSFERMTGYTHDEIDAKGQFALYHPDEQAHVAADMQRAEHGETFGSEYRIITKSGEIRWLRIFRKPVWSETEQRVVRFFGVAQDITERKRSDEELRRSEEKYRLLAENATDMIARVTVDGFCTYVSSASQTLLGCAPEALVGRRLLDLIHPEDYESVSQVFDALLTTNEALTFACRMHRQNGEYLWFEVTAKAIRDPASGALREFIAVSRDITHRKQMDAILLEQERLRLELQTEQELSAVKSNLMRTISHEFRTPLTMILTAVDFLDTYLERLEPENRRERLQAIRVQIKRLSEMLDDISFVVQGALNRMIARPSRINLEMYCRSVLDDIQLTIGKNHRFSFISDGKLEQAVADKALVVRILGNLLSNAVKYSPEDSTITLQMMREGSDAVLRVSDEGIGISPEEQKRIFEPFYRSDRVIDTVGGTGLGLSIVKDCVELQGGSITVASEMDNGTTFTVRLPQNEL